MFLIKIITIKIFLFNGHQRVPSFPFCGIRKIVFFKDINDCFFIESQIRIYLTFFSQGRIYYNIGIMSVSKNLDILVVWFQMAGEDKGIEYIIMTRVNY